MNDVIEFLLNNYIIIFLLYILAFIIIIFILYKIKKTFNGEFHEANIIRRLKRIYNELDYPYIDKIILPINKESYAYYDAIIFGDKYIYIIEIKNHNGTMVIDPLDDWTFIDKKKKKYTFINPFYELELKKHILNRFLELDKSRIVEVVIYNNNLRIKGNKGNNHLIAANQIKSLIKHYEKKEYANVINPDLIEKKGNYILDINVKKNKIRKYVISDLKNQRVKR